LPFRAKTRNTSPVFPGFVPLNRSAFRRWSGTTPSDFRRLHRERDMGSPLALEPSAPLL
jgi:AraC-like DNA-binding protein